QLLEGVVTVLAIVLALVAWIVFGRRKNEPEPMGQSMPPGRPGSPPSGDSDPLDLPLPPAPPKD
ncbi:MAG: hypothetical protein L3J78_03155, partial [Thermoplasmata archaeon]|nr:hypothetical protein [Thermoplasmata archaeon]